MADTKVPGLSVTPEELAAAIQLIKSGKVKQAAPIEVEEELIQWYVCNGPSGPHGFTEKQARKLDEDNFVKGLCPDPDCGGSLGQAPLITTHPEEGRRVVYQKFTPEWHRPTQPGEPITLTFAEGAKPADAQTARKMTETARPVEPNHPAPGSTEEPEDIEEPQESKETEQTEEPTETVSQEGK